MSKVNYIFGTITENTMFPAEGCNAIEIENTGNVSMTIFNKQYLPGDAYRAYGNVGDKDFTSYDVRFDTSLGGMAKADVIRKFDK